MLNSHFYLQNDLTPKMIFVLTMAGSVWMPPEASRSPLELPLDPDVEVEQFERGGGVELQLACNSS